MATAPAQRPSADRLRVIVAGGGVAALEAVLALRALAPRGVSLDLIAPEPAYTYRPLVPEPIGMVDVRRLPLARFAAQHEATLHADRLVAVDTRRRAVSTARGARLSYDMLLLAIGGRLVEAVPGALTYRGDDDAGRLADILAAAAAGRAGRLAFVVPAGAGWPVPIYELAILAADWLSSRDAGAELSIITAEPAPLASFGREASRGVSELLRRKRIEVRLCSVAEGVDDGRLRMEHDGSVRADRVVALPLVLGQPVAGLDQDPHCFLRVDELCRVDGHDDVYAAGDVTAGPFKYGGLAAEQADVAAAAIASRAGARVQCPPYAPALRGLLLTGEVPRYLRRSIRCGGGLTLDHDALWWPPHKITGRHLVRHLAADLDLAAPAGAGHIEVDEPAHLPVDASS